MEVMFNILAHPIVMGIIIFFSVLNVLHMIDPRCGKPKIAIKDIKNTGEK